MRVKITKRSEVTGGAPARAADDHIPGHVQPAGYSLPVEYTLEGELVEPITVGKGVKVNRDTRNGVKVPGIFVTTPVIEFTGTTFRTRNSVYDLEVLG